MESVSYGLPIPFVYALKELEYKLFENKSKFIRNSFRGWLEEEKRIISVLDLLGKDYEIPKGKRSLGFTTATILKKDKEDIKRFVNIEKTYPSISEFVRDALRNYLKDLIIFIEDLKEEYKIETGKKRTTYEGEDIEAFREWKKRRLKKNIESVRKSRLPFLETEQIRINLPYLFIHILRELKKYGIGNISYTIRNAIREHIPKEKNLIEFLRLLNKSKRSKGNRKIKSVCSCLIKSEIGDLKSYIEERKTYSSVSEFIRTNLRNLFLSLIESNKFNIDTSRIEEVLRIQKEREIQKEEEIQKKIQKEKKVIEIDKRLEMKLKVNEKKTKEENVIYFIDRYCIVNKKLIFNKILLFRAFNRYLEKNDLRFISKSSFSYFLYCIFNISRTRTNYREISLNKEGAKLIGMENDFIFLRQEKLLKLLEDKISNSSFICKEISCNLTFTFIKNIVSNYNKNRKHNDERINILKAKIILKDLEKYFFKRNIFKRANAKLGIIIFLITNIPISQIYSKFNVYESLIRNNYHFIQKQSYEIKRKLFRYWKRNNFSENIRYKELLN